MPSGIPWSYPVIMLVAIGSAGWLLRRTQSGLGLSRAHKAAIAVGAFCGAMIGAKIPFVLADSVSTDWEGLQTGAVWFSNGKTIVCGMVGAYFGVELTKWIFRIGIKTGDTFALPAAVAVGIGRLGCLAAGCCFGTPTTLPWGMRFQLADQGATPRHPTQLYEAAFHFSLAIAIVFLQRAGIWRGQLVKFYILAYLVYRWLTEFIRPEPSMWFSMTAYQWFALAMMPVFGYLWHRDARIRP